MRNKAAKKSIGIILSVILILFTFGGIIGKQPQTIYSVAPYGEPWVSSMVAGNLPAEVPRAQDDLYLYYNYDEIREHRGENYSSMTGDTNAIIEEILTSVMDGSIASSKDGAYTDKEIMQLKILCEQASDLETLKDAGIKELQPYLDMIENAKTLDELNDVLVADDFPFCPYFSFLTKAYDMSANNNVEVDYQYLFSTPLEASTYYQDSDDAMTNSMHQVTLDSYAFYVAKDMEWLGISEEEALEKVKELVELEKSFAKYAINTSKYQDKEYGAYSKAFGNLSLEELSALCPNYPLKATAKKFGKDRSPFFTVADKEWIEYFNKAWTEDNLGLLKLFTQAKVLKECENYLDPSISDDIREKKGEKPVDGTSNAVNVCNQPETFSQLFGKIYVELNYALEEHDRLQDLAAEIIEAYKRLVSETPWLDDISRKNMLLKLDRMRINILYPEGGYTDFSDLELVSTGDGGSLLGNYLKIKKYLNEKSNALIGEPASSRAIWDMLGPMMANCYYDESSNSINILPGFLAMDIYQHGISDEDLLGGIGWVLGHEISHGFDFGGSQFDAYGMPNSILTDDDVGDFVEKADRLVAYYDKLEPAPNIYVDGDHVKMEAIADLCGLQLALEVTADRESFDYKEFFKKAEVIWCMALQSDMYLKYMMAIDTHPLNNIRGNVNQQMFDEFYDTYDVKEGDGMYLPKEERIQFWGEGA